MFYGKPETFDNFGSNNTRKIKEIKWDIFRFNIIMT